MCTGLITLADKHSPFAITINCKVILPKSIVSYVYSLSRIARLSVAAGHLMLRLWVGCVNALTPLSFDLQRRRQKWNLATVVQIKISGSEKNPQTESESVIFKTLKVIVIKYNNSSNLSSLFVPAWMNYLC